VTCHTESLWLPLFIGRVSQHLQVPLTEEIRLKIFGSPDCPNFPSTLLSDRDFCLLPWKSFWNLGDSRQNLFESYGELRWLVWNFGSRKYFQSDLLRPWWLVIYIVFVTCHIASSCVYWEFETFYMENVWFLFFIGRVFEHHCSWLVICRGSSWLSIFIMWVFEHQFVSVIERDTHRDSHMHAYVCIYLCMHIYICTRTCHTRTHYIYSIYYIYIYIYTYYIHGAGTCAKVPLQSWRWCVDW